LAFNEIKKMKKILLIGKSGQLGGELINNSPAFDFEIFSFERKELDVTNELQIKDKMAKIKPDILINTSAYHVVPKCEENPMAAMTVNFLAIDKMARLCKKDNVKFITYSTDYVFDGEKGSPYEENDKPNPLQIYGISKLAGEYVALNAHPEGAIVIRTCGVYGGKAGSPEKGGNFVLNIIEEAKNENIMEVSSEQIVNPTFAGDLSQATLKLLTSIAQPGIYHLANNGYCSWHEFAQEIFKLAGINKKIKPIDRQGLSGKMKRPKFSALKNTKAKALGIELPSWQEGLKSYFKFLNN
jgi:dTDP-4-dehydrorhamnose reductase